MSTSGLDNIVKSIARESEEKVQRLWDDFNLKKKASLSSVKSFIESFEEENFRSVLKNMQRQDEKVKSLAAMKFRDGILKAKIKIAEEVLESAKKFISDLPDEEYFSVVLKICSGHFSKEKNAELVFSKKDFSRFSDDLKEKFISEALKSGMKLTIICCEADKNFSGAVLRLGNVEENCTFDAIFDERREELLNFLLEFLFSDCAVENFGNDVKNIEIY